MTEKSTIPYDTISRVSVSSQSIFNKCCCCIPLRIGCFILGYLDLVVNCVHILSLAKYITLVDVNTHGFDHFDFNFIVKFVFAKTDLLELQENTTETPEFAEAEHEISTEIGYILAFLLVANIIWMFINIVCLVGLHKKRPGLIRVYIGFATTRLMLVLAAVIYLVMSNKAQLQYIVGNSFHLALSAYYIPVYYKYAVQLEKEREAEATQRASAPFNNALYSTMLNELKNIEKIQLVA